MAEGRTYTVREGLEAANARLVPLETHTDLTPAERSLVAALRNANDAALAALRPDNTIAGGQRDARANQIENAFKPLGQVEANKSGLWPPQAIGDFYDGLELSNDCASCIRQGIPTFFSGLSR